MRESRWFGRLGSEMSDVSCVDSRNRRAASIQSYLALELTHTHLSHSCIEINLRRDGDDHPIPSRKGYLISPMDLLMGPSMKARNPSDGQSSILFPSFAVQSTRSTEYPLRL